MLFSYMSNLMGEHCGQLRLVLHFGESALRYEYISAGSGESIDDISVDDSKPELDLRPVGKLGQAFPNLIYILIELAIFIIRVLTKYPRSQYPAKDNLG